MNRFRPRSEGFRAWAFHLGITPGIFGIFNQKWIKSGRFRWQKMVKTGKTGGNQGGIRAGTADGSRNGKKWKQKTGRFKQKWIKSGYYPRNF